MFAKMNEIQVNIMTWLLRWLSYIKNERFAIHFQILISFFIIKLGLNLEEEDPDHNIKFTKSDYFTTQFLVRMEFLERNDNDGYRFRLYRSKRQMVIDAKKKKTFPARQAPLYFENVLSHDQTISEDVEVPQANQHFTTILVLVTCKIYIFI